MEKTSSTLNTHFRAPKLNRHQPDMSCIAPTCGVRGRGHWLSTLTRPAYRSWQCLSLSSSALRAEVLVLGLSLSLVICMCEGIYMCQLYMSWPSGTSCGLWSWVLWCQRNQVIVCLVMACLTWLALSFSSYFVAVERFYGNAGGLSPCAHILPREQKLL